MRGREKGYLGLRKFKVGNRICEKAPGFKQCGVVVVPPTLRSGWFKIRYDGKKRAEPAHANWFYTLSEYRKLRLTANPQTQTLSRRFDGKLYHYKTWIPYKLTAVAHVRNLRKRGVYARWHPENRGYSVWIRPKPARNPFDIATIGTGAALGVGFAASSTVLRRMFGNKVRRNPRTKWGAPWDPQMWDEDDNDDNPLRQFCCSVCASRGKRACVPKKYLVHGQFENRMRWLRRHYAEHHPGMWPWGKKR